MVPFNKVDFEKLRARAARNHIDRLLAAQVDDNSQCAVLLKHMQPMKYTKLGVGGGQRHSENKTPHPLFVYKICWPFSLKTLKINDKNDLLKLSAYLVFFLVFSEKQPCSDMVRYFCCLAYFYVSKHFILQFNVSTITNPHFANTSIIILANFCSLLIV